MKFKKSFTKGWKNFYEKFPNAPKGRNAMTICLREILEVETIQSLYNYRDGKYRITPRLEKEITKFFRSLGIESVDVWDDPDTDDGTSSDRFSSMVS